MRTLGVLAMVEVAVLGTDGGEFAAGACDTALTFFEQAEMVRSLSRLKFGEAVRVGYRSLEDGRDPEIAERVRAGELELPLVLVDGRVAFSGAVPWRDLQAEIAQALAAR